MAGASNQGRGSADRLESSVDPSRRLPRLHIVTDDAVLARPGFLDDARRALGSGGADLALHIRGPHTRGAEVYRISAVLAEDAEASASLLVVNDRVDVALSLGVGVHLGRRSLPVPSVRRMVGDGTTVGCSTHDVGEVAEGGRGGADYVFFGNVFVTPSHPGRPGAGVDALASAAEAARGIPVLAIGGVTTSNVGELLGAGAWGVAVLRGVWDAREPEGAVSDYISALEGHAAGAPRGAHDDHQ